VVEKLVVGNLVRKVNHSGFNEARDDGMAVASAAPYTNHLHLSPDR